MTLLIVPITPAIGASITVDPSAICAGENPQWILDALNKYGVLVFPEIHLSDEAMVELTSKLGDMEAATVTADGSDQSNKGIYRIAKDKTDKGLSEYVAGNDYWHMDGTSYEAPGKATLLKCQSPPSAGGETDFANLVSAYQAMPAEMKKRIENLRVIHCMESVMRKVNPTPSDEDVARWHAIFPPTEHPLVWHMRDGRTSLVIGSTAGGIVGMWEDDATALLDELTDWCTQDRFTYMHSWKAGDLVIFNNPLLLHRSLPYTADSGRELRRTTIKGTESFA
jgi:alpha-ketoglutarate-dependent taurine dioxygenase